MINKFFVYGTLMRGMSNQHFIDDKAVKSTKSVFTKGSLYWVNRGSYPAMVFENENEFVHGELVEIKDEYLSQTIKSCDHLEGHPSFYKRIIITVTDADDNTYEAYAYEFLHYNMLGDKIENGDFKSAFKQKFKHKIHS